jgi:hypothetical protein
LNLDGSPFFHNFTPDCAAERNSAVVYAAGGSEICIPWNEGFADCDLQSRVSPFANRKRKKFSGQLSREDLHSKATLTGDNSQRKGSIPEQHESSDSGWLSLKRYFQCQCKALAHVKKPYHGLHGCVTFEILWADVRGINYSNELQVRSWALGSNSALTAIMDSLTWLCSSMCLD